MKIRLAAILLLALPAAGATHKDAFPVPCGELWAAVDDTLRNSGKYDIAAMDPAGMAASYKIGGTLGQVVAWPRPRANSVSLLDSGASCEMSVRSSFSGLAHDDAGGFLRRVQQSLAQQKGVAPATVVTPPSRPVLAQAASEPVCRNIVVDKSGHRVCFD
jgi:hypothetical protein